MKEYRIETIAKKAVSRLYSRKGKRLNSESFARLKKWYNGFLNEDPESFDWQWKVLNEIHCGFEEACRYDILSSDFRDRIFSALSLGTAYIERFADVADKYFSVFVERLTYMCGVIVGYILTQNLECMDERLKISLADFEDDFQMDIFGVYPTHFLNDGLLLVGAVRTGTMRAGDMIGLPVHWDCRDYGRYNDILINSVGEVIEASMFGKRITEVKAGDVCVLSVKYGGMLMKDNSYPYPFHIYKTGPIPDIRMASEEEREIAYGDEYSNYQLWDNSSLKLSASDLMYLETVRIALGISEKRAKEIELARIRHILSKKNLECFEAVRDCLYDIDVQSLK